MFILIFKKYEYRIFFLDVPRVWWTVRAAWRTLIPAPGLDVTEGRAHYKSIKMSNKILYNLWLEYIILINQEESTAMINVVQMRRRSQGLRCVLEWKHNNLFRYFISAHHSLMLQYN